MDKGPKRLKYRWGMEIDNIPTNITVNPDLLKKLEERQKMASNKPQKISHKFMPLKNPNEFSATTRLEVEKLNLPNYEHQSYTQKAKSIKSESSTVSEDEVKAYFGSRELEFNYSDEDFPSLSNPSKSTEIKTNDEVLHDYRCLEISGLPESVSEEGLRMYLQDFGNVFKVILIKNGDKSSVTALVWIQTNACEWVISCLDGQITVIRDVEVTLHVNYKN